MVAIALLALGASAGARRRRPEGARAVHAGEHLLRPRPVRQGDRRLAAGLPAQERSRVPLQHRAGLPARGGRPEGDLLLQALPEQRAQGPQPRRGRAEDRGAAEAALDAGAGQGAAAAWPVRPGQSGRHELDHAAQRRDDHAAAANQHRSIGDRHRSRPHHAAAGRRQHGHAGRGHDRGPAGAARRRRTGSTCAPRWGSTPGRRGCRRTPRRRSRFTLAGGYTFGNPAAQVRFRLGALFGYTFLKETDSKDTFVSFLVDPTIVVRRHAEAGADGRTSGSGCMSISGLKPTSALLELVDGQRQRLAGAGARSGSASRASTT